MKKVLFTLMITLSLGMGKVWADGPFTTTLTADGFDATPDAIATPAQTGTPSNNVADVKDVINYLLGTTYATNGDVDFLKVTTGDSFWKTLSSPATIAAISVSADNFNVLNVYDTTAPATKYDVFGGAFTGYGFIGDGSLSNPFLSANSPLAAGTTFGWTLDSFGAYYTGSWDSDPTKNADGGYDHLFTYHLADLKGKSVYLQNIDGSDPSLYTFNDPYLLAWEDISFEADGLLTDQDFNDLTFIVDRVAPVAAPEPVSTVLFLTGGLAMAGNELRRRMKLA